MHIKSLIILGAIIDLYQSILNGYRATQDDQKKNSKGVTIITPLQVCNNWIAMLDFSLVLYF